MDCDETTSRFLLLLSLRSARVHQVDADDGHSRSCELNFIQRLTEEQITKQRREHRGEERERAQLREASLGREVEKCPVRQRGTQEGGVLLYTRFKKNRDEGAICLNLCRSFLNRIGSRKGREHAKTFQEATSSQKNVRAYEGGQ